MSDKTGFDLGAILAELNVSDPDTGREQIEYIDTSLLDNDPNNFYELRNLDTLADNIATCGLQQPLRVRRHPENEGRYIIVSGHRRRAAVEILAAEEPEKWKEIPCIVERDSVSPSLQQLRLIYANAHTRTLTSAEISEQAVQVEKLLYQLKEEGHEFPGRMRDHVAQAVGASNAKLARLKVIRDDLIPMWQPEFKAGRLREATAYAMAQLPKEWQNMMYNRWGSSVSCLYEGHAKNVREVIEKIAKVDCSIRKGCKCTISSTRMLHITGLGQYDSWSCSGCCLDCSSLATCKDNCYLADKKKCEIQEKRKAEKAAQKTAEKEKIAPTLELIRGVYGRWSAALEKKGLSAEEYLRACGRTYVGDAEEFAKNAAHPEKVKPALTRLPFARALTPSDIETLTTAADVLDCSIDWLLGRKVSDPDTGENVSDSDTAPESFPVPEAWGEAEWEDPVHSGEYVVLAKWSEQGAVKPYIFEWDGSKWLYSGSDAAAAGAIVLYWMPMP